MKFATEQDKARYEAAVAANLSTIVDRGYEEKYKGYGIYCIKVDGMIVYIGKSRDMLRRLAYHMTDIDLNTDKNMYNVLRVLRENHKISFDVMRKTTEGDEDEMGYAEAYAINHYRPCLNIQYPKLDNYHSSRYLGTGGTITAEEIEKFLDNN